MRKEIFVLIIILFFHASLLTKLIFFPYPELFIYPYLTNQGLIPYKQIFDQHFPGLLFLPINFATLGMTSPEIARIWLIIVTLLTQILIFVVGKQVFKSARKALLTNFLFLIFHPFLSGWILWIDNFLPLFFLPAFYFSYHFTNQQKKSNLILVLIGLLMGGAILFKQVSLPLAFILGGYLFYQHPKIHTIYFYLVGLIPLPLLMFGYFYFLGAFKEFRFWTIQFNLTTYAKYGRPTPEFALLTRVWGLFSPILLLPFLKNKPLIILLGVFLIGTLAGTLDRFDLVHFQPVLPFLVITIVLVFSQFWSKSLFKLLIVGYFIVITFWMIIFLKGHLSNSVFLFDAQTIQVGKKIKELTNPNEEIFVFGAVPHLYSLSQTLPAGKIFVFQFPWFLMETEERFLNVLKTSPPRLVVQDRTVKIDDVPITEYASRLDSYIEQNYVVIDKIGTTEFLQKK